MFFPSDPISEIVVHFLGYFEIAVEDMRIRHQLETMERESEEVPQDSDLEQVGVEIKQSYTLGAFSPGVHYDPPDWLIRGEAPISAIHVDLRVPGAQVEIGINPPSWSNQLPAPELPTPPFIGPEPGSVIAVISQTIVLSDNDVISMGVLEEPIHFASGADSGIAAMQAATLDVLGPVASGMGLEGPGDMPRLLEKIEAAIGEQEADPSGEFHAVDDLAGVYVNGRSVDEAPELEDALPEQVRAIETENDDAPAVEETGAHEAGVELIGDEIEGSVTFNGGGNHLVNEVAVLNAGVVSTHLAIAGDLHQLDAIIQVNVYSDIDTVEAGFPLEASGTGGATMAVNVASFIQETRDGDEAAEAKPGVMPANWQVTVVNGDIMFLEWMKQLTFVSDQDIGVLSATGNTTTITSGENLALNNVTLQNIGLLFDLILVGGNVYDANIVIQTNILYDNDTLGLLGEGDVHAAEGGYDGGGNLLWNQASIHNVGATDVQSELSDHYAEAMNRLDNGDFGMPEGFGGDHGLEGIAVPRVLYITGNIYDLRYVEQTNILGDADFVALQRSAFLDNQPETTWQIHSGSNALVNIATIKDYDTFGDTMQVAGNHYSDAVLIQAEILAGDGSDGGPDALVTEVVAFLDSSEDLADVSDHAMSDALHDAAPADLMQSVLA